MKNTVHVFFIVFLFIIGLAAVAAIGLRNFDYYLLPFQERPFHPNYDLLKPSGFESHGYGIVGTAMIMFGVILYSSRKRIKSLKQIGKIKYFLEFHIFLCLVGPMLVLYHTTFKFGGIVSVSFWSMMAVVASGVIGRYLYIHIPKNIGGNELSSKEIEEENRSLLNSLRDDAGLSIATIQFIDSVGTPKKPVAMMTTMEIFSFIMQSDFKRRKQIRSIRRILEKQGIDKHKIKEVLTIARDRVVLLQRIAFLEKLRQIFHYWHVIHLPFSIIMFIILIVHVGVAIAFGYTWIW